MKSAKALAKFAGYEDFYTRVRCDVEKRADSEECNGVDLDD